MSEVDEMDDPRGRSPLMAALEDLEFEVTIEGRKTSEGDGRTAADIEREMAAAAAQEDE